MKHINKQINYIWYVIKWIKLFLLALIFVPFACISTIRKLAGKFIYPLLQLVLVISEIMVLYQIFVLKTNNYFLIIIPILAALFSYLFLYYSFWITLNIKIIIKTIYYCKYGQQIKWSYSKLSPDTKRTYDSSASTIPNNSDYLQAIYEKKVQTQREYYETELKKKEYALEEIRKQNENNNFFIGITNKDDLKRRYHDLLKVYHPDNQNGNLLMTVYLKEKYNEELKKYV